MKPKLSIGVCIVLSLALVVFGVLYGVYQGYQGERQQVTALLKGDNGLFDALSYRGADGLNLCVVAGRHLTDDPDVAALKAAANSLRNGPNDLNAKMKEDQKLENAVALVAQKLAATPSFQQSARDQSYLNMLTSDMQNLTKSANAGAYNAAAKEFNALFDTPLIGSLAKLLGVEPCTLFE